MTERESDRITVPYFGIQSDWEQCLDKRGGSCWVSVRKFGEEKSVHGELKCSSTDPLQLNGTEPFKCVKEKTSTRCLTLKDSNSNTQCGFVAPSAEFNSIHRSSIISLDVSEGGLGLSVDTNNELKIWETNTGIVRRTLNGHPIDAYTCKFFPSGIVVLSGGADCCLKIWSAETGECPVTLRGHTAAVRDLCVVERGRNVISVSKDGTAKLWDCGESKAITTLFSCRSELNSCCLMAPTQFDVGSPLPSLSEREILTAGKLLIVGREDSKVCGISVAARNLLFTCNLPSAVNRVLQTGANSFVAGCQTGEVAMFDLRNVSCPHTVLFPTTTPVLDLMVHPRSSGSSSFHSFWVSKSDGSCIFVNPNDISSLLQLTGPNCDPVYQMKSDLDAIYTACRDSIVRKYSMNVINRLL